MNVLTEFTASTEGWLCLALENVQSELFDMKTKYDEATSAKYVVQKYFGVFPINEN